MDRKQCRHIHLAGSGNIHIEYCRHGLIHLHYGTFSMRFSQEQFNALIDTIRIGIDRLHDLAMEDVNPAAFGLAEEYSD